jgi:integrase
MRTNRTGITVRHSRRCRSRDGGRCACTPTYQASVWSKRDGRLIRKTFPSISAAKSWRQDAQVALRRGEIRGSSTATVSEAAEAWLEGARSGAFRNRSGDAYKPSVIRTYETALRRRLVPAIGRRRLSDLTRADVQDLADGMLAGGIDPSTIRNTLMPLRCICRRALARGEIAVNPTTGLELPAVRGRRDRVASPTECDALLAALPDRDRAVWATAMFAGLRLGELQGLRVQDVDLGAGLLRVERGWDAIAGPVEPKSRAGRRRVPIAAALRSHLAAHLMRLDRRDGLVFGHTAERPFYPTPLRRRADAAWSAAGLRRITLHEARHACASMMIAAGINAKALSTYLGHESIALTFDRYGHLMPGNESEAAGLLDTYLDAHEAT